MFSIVLLIVLGILSVALCLCFVRAIIGPTTSDRIVALDTFGLILVGTIGTLMIQQETIAYSEVLLVIGILAFVGSVALSKFLERGGLFERD
ncbi:Na(+)/H(+) antiporter subunit F1 [Alkalicoccobacillus gibsonii]|jgi:multicomponent Na+:H+ antiporter subunit F|uniref:Na(+)/H(+) antiporter subunit F1 n=1 Tax=Alkalicoccobacillus gibsonii TaxID=79881 RepID=A0ABU9VGM2_9BACI|nr:Na(+)/H(+) antiporter subunit F1 [Alkalicoccobacillus gibsonii]MBM0064269.1 Na(+)/H(+) antiporter subunit F1 [Alkalicoccobacillus gibsonii]